MKYSVTIMTIIGARNLQCLYLYLNKISIFGAIQCNNIIPIGILK